LNVLNPKTNTTSWWQRISQLAVWISKVLIWLLTTNFLKMPKITCIALVARGALNKKAWPLVLYPIATWNPWFALKSTSKKNWTPFGWTTLILSLILNRFRQRTFIVLALTKVRLQIADHEETHPTVVARAEMMGHAAIATDLAKRADREEMAGDGIDLHETMHPAVLITIPWKPQDRIMRGPILRDQTTTDPRTGLFIATANWGVIKIPTETRTALKIQDAKMDRQIVLKSEIKIAIRVAAKSDLITGMIEALKNRLTVDPLQRALRQNQVALYGVRFLAKSNSSSELVSYDY
jgi:hypothetical protein